eukprot:gene7421-8682_t
MIILIKTPTITFSLDVDPSDKVEMMKKKIADRTSFKTYQFQILFAGEPLDDQETVSGCGIKKEGTLHLNIIKQLSYNVEFKSVVYPITLPNNEGLTVSSLHTMLLKAIGTAGTSDVRNIRFTQGNHKLNPADALQEAVSTELTVYTQFDEYDPNAEVPAASGESSSNGEDLQNALPQIDQDLVLANFIEGSVSADVEIVFCFDTTGSMSSIIKEVRTKVRETVTKLIDQIESIKIGIVGLGDFCDNRNLYTSMDLTSNVDSLVKFIDGIPSTGGGDEPEAYEYALYKAKSFSWSKHTSKAFVMIGDSPPHPPYYTNKHIDWVRETDDLEALGIKIYGIVCCHERSRYFYQTISERTGGLCVTFNRFNLISDMFLAICYREASKEKYDKFKKETEKNNGGDNEDLGKMFSELDKANFEVSTTLYDEPTTTTTTTTTTTNTTGPVINDSIAPQKIKKRYGELSNIPQNTTFCEWTNYQTVNGSGAGWYQSYRHVAKSLFIASRSNKTTYRNPARAMVLGDLHIGFSTFSKTLILERLQKKGKILFHDYRLDGLNNLPQCSIFAATYACDSYASFARLDAIIDDVKKRHPGVVVVLVGLKSDLTPKDGSSALFKRSRSKSVISLQAEVDAAAAEATKTITKNDRELLIRNKGLVGEVTCSSMTPSSVVAAEKTIFKMYQQHTKSHA